MTNYTNILNTGIALLLEIALGFVCIKFKFIPKKYLAAINKYDFKLTFIPLMARSFAIRDLYSMNFKPLGACVLMSISSQILLAILCFSLPFQDKFRTFLGILLPVIYINYVIIGIPLFDSIWGSENNAITSVIIMSNDLIIVPVYNVLSTIYNMRLRNKTLRESNLPEEKFTFTTILKVIKNVFMSPIIQGIIVGIIWSLTTISLPLYLDKLMIVISQTISACALFCVGGFLAQHSLIACKWSEFVIGVLFRFIIMPLLGLVFSYAIGLTATESRQVCVMASVTSAVACYPISVSTRIGEGVASTMIFWSTVLFIPFVIFWLWILDQLNLFIE